MLQHCSLSFRNALFGVLAVLTVPGWANSQLSSGSLTIDDETISQSIVDTYGKSFIARKEYCPPVSDRFALDSFVRNVLIARQSKNDEIESRNRMLEKAIQPLLEKIEKLEILVEKNVENEHIAQVYKKQIQRTELDIKELERQSEEYYERRTWFSIRSSLYDRLERLQDATDADKNYLVSMMGFVDLYTDKLRASIKNEMAQKRYERLIEEKDERLVDVYSFRYRNLTLTANDDSTIEMATDFLKNDIHKEPKNTGLEYYKNVAPNVHIRRGPASSRHRWSQLNNVEAVKENPSAVVVGDVFVEKDIERTVGGIDAYRLTYIDEIKHYPLILSLIHI